MNTYINEDIGYLGSHENCDDSFGIGLAIG